MRGTLRAGLAVAVAGICAGILPSIAGAAPACTPVASPADEATLAGLINAQRRAEHVPKVVKQADLMRQGRKKSMAMAAGAKFAHSASGGLSFAHGGAGAQNIAMAPTVQEAFQAMLDSPPHRANMMSKEYRLTGVGAARDCNGEIFFTVNLMAPPS
jgi:uncharacterized protein YkwD